MVEVDSDHDQTVRRCNAAHRSASLFLIGLDLGGSPAGYSDDCFADSPKLKALCMMRLAGGEGGSIPPRGSFFYIRGACMMPMVMWKPVRGLNKP